MAETSLDDFFAKKDKSKRKAKKFTTSDQVAKKMEDGSGKKPPEKNTGIKKEKEKVTNSSTSSVPTTQPYQEQEDEEWLEVEEKEIDYSGLKIQNLQISELRDDELEKEKADEYTEEGELIGHRDGSGPWNKNTPTPVVAPPVVEPVKEKPPTNYCPPHLRAGATHGGGGKMKSRAAPEITNEEHFPSLSAAGGGAPRKKGDRSPDYERPFESVKRGSRNIEDANSKSAALDVGNKFGPLSHGETS